MVRARESSTWALRALHQDISSASTHEYGKVVRIVDCDWRPTLAAVERGTRLRATGLTMREGWLSGRMRPRLAREPRRHSAR